MKNIGHILNKYVVQLVEVKYKQLIASMCNISLFAYTSCKY